MHIFLLNSLTCQLIFVCISYLSMLSSDSIQLRKRCVDSFNEYFNVISDDGILAMIVNPLLLCRGLPDLEACWDSEGGKYDRFVNKAKGLLKAMVEQMFKPDVVSANEGGESGKIIVHVLR